MTIPLPVSVDEVRAWCRLDNTDDDATLLSLIRTASAAAASYTGLDFTLGCPAPVRQAIALMAADLYANREGQVVGWRTFEALLAPHRVTAL